MEDSWLNMANYKIKKLMLKKDFEFALNILYIYYTSRTGQEK